MTWDSCCEAINIGSFRRFQSTFEDSFINSSDKDGCSLLFLAICRRQENVAMFLLEHPKIDPNISKKTSKNELCSPLYMATDKRMEKVAFKILERVSVTTFNLKVYGRTVLELAKERDLKTLVQSFEKFQMEQEFKRDLKRTGSICMDFQRAKMKLEEIEHEQLRLDEQEEEKGRKRSNQLKEEILQIQNAIEALKRRMKSLNIEKKEVDTKVCLMRKQRIISSCASKEYEMLKTEWESRNRSISRGIQNLSAIEIGELLGGEGISSSAIYQIRQLKGSDLFNIDEEELKEVYKVDLMGRKQICHLMKKCKEGTWNVLPSEEENWTVSQVQKWFESNLNENQLKPVKRAPMNGTTLLLLKSNDLKELGITDFLERKEILLKISSLKNKPNNKRRPDPDTSEDTTKRMRIVPTIPERRFSGCLPPLESLVR